MKIVIIYDGEEYVSEDTDEIKAEELTEKVFEQFANLDRFKMKLRDGGFLLLGSGAIQNCAIIIKDT